MLCSMTNDSGNTWELGDVIHIVPESIGEPGSRRFRINVTCSNGSGLLWVEKEQLYELALAIKQLLGHSVPEHNNQWDSVYGVATADFEFYVTSISLGHDQSSDRYMLSTEVDDAMGSLTIWMSEFELDGFADQAFDVCASGRTRCPLCGVPLRTDDQAHVCAKTNGHHKPDE
mgnify:CR=1 FL=1